MDKREDVLFSSLSLRMQEKSQVQKTHWETLHIQNYSTSSHNVHYRGA